MLLVVSLSCWNRFWTTRLTQAVIKGTSSIFLFALLGVFKPCCCFARLHTYALHAHLSVRSGGERGQVWPSVSLWETISLFMANTRRSRSAKRARQPRWGWGGTEATGPGRWAISSPNGPGANLLILVIPSSWKQTDGQTAALEQSKGHRVRPLPQ